MYLKNMWPFIFTTELMEFFVTEEKNFLNYPNSVHQLLFLCGNVNGAFSQGKDFFKLS
jgi:hypothetical protein